jgi:hypothetical protein
MSAVNPGSSHALGIPLRGSGAGAALLGGLLAERGDRKEAEAAFKRAAARRGTASDEKEVAQSARAVLRNLGSGG